MMEGDGHSGRPRALARPLCWAVVGLALTAVAAVGVLAGGGWYVANASGGGWMAAALKSRLFITCAIVLAASALGLAALSGVLWRAGAAGRRRRDGQSGVAILEFALVLPIALMLSLLMAQSTMLMGGNLCVHYSAYCAARSAIVQVPADYGPVEPRNIVGTPDASAKLRRIKLAAMYAVTPVSCRSVAYRPGGDARILADGLREFFEQYNEDAPGWADHEDLARMVSYAEEHTAVSLASPADGRQYGPHEDLRVSVKHTFYLSVPYANWLFTHLDPDGVELGFGPGEYGMVMRASCRLTNEGVRDYVDTEKFTAETK